MTQATVSDFGLKLAFTPLLAFLASGWLAFTPLAQAHIPNSAGSAVSSLVTALLPEDAILQETKNPYFSLEDKFIAAGSIDLEQSDGDYVGRCFKPDTEAAEPQESLLSIHKDRAPQTASAGPLFPQKEKFIRHISVLDYNGLKGGLESSRSILLGDYFKFWDDNKGNAYYQAKHNAVGEVIVPGAAANQPIFTVRKEFKDKSIKHFIYVKTYDPAIALTRNCYFWKKWEQASK